MVELEDLYRPYKPKRRTRATIAAEKGLQPLADILLKQETDDTPENLASSYVDSEKGVASVEEALSGAGDIIAENISDRADLRTRIREITTAEGILTSEVKKDQDDPQSVYAQYFHFQGKVSALKGHQILALNRGEKEKVLAVSLQAPRIGSWASSGMPSSPGRMRRRRAPGTCLRGCLQQADRACD